MHLVSWCEGECYFQWCGPVSVMSSIGIGKNRQFVLVCVSAENGWYFYLNNIIWNIGSRHTIYLKYNFQVFQCLCTLLRDPHIDNTFKDQPITKFKIINLISIFPKFTIQKYFLLFLQKKTLRFSNCVILYKLNFESFISYLYGIIV